MNEGHQHDPNGPIDCNLCRSLRRIVDAALAATTPGEPRP